MPPRSLNGRQERFIVEYFVDNNATQAAIRAGYTAQEADKQGTRLLQHPKIKAAIEAHKDAVREQCVTKESELLHFWGQVMVSTTEKMRDRLRASENIAKHIGMFTERLDVSGKVDGPAVFIMPRPSDPPK